MPDPVTATNASLEREAPALSAALSPLGRRVAERPDPALHGTTGQVTGGEAAAQPPAVARAFRLGAEDLHQALHYSPVEGLPELRRRWREWQRRDVPEAVPSTLPLVTAGLTHALSLAADVFGGEGRAVAFPSPFWGNYRQTFATRTGARVLTAPAYGDGRYNVQAIPQALADLPPGDPAVAILNLPSNPGGYAPDPAERRALLEALLGEAERRPLVVLCDDAYAGLVYEDEIPRASLFWDMVEAHPNLVPVKIDGGTKEFSFFGGRVGFLTFGLPADSGAARSLESKLRCLSRATLGSPPASSQVVLLQALRQPGIEQEVEKVRALLEGRYRALKGALGKADPALLRALPFNSGCFALVELPEPLGITADEARRHLLAHQDVGLISIEPRYLRIAHCAVDASALPELVRRLEQGIAELAGRRAATSRSA